MKKPTAFTLVELLVVIGIIAVLIGILLPSLGKARDSAKAVQCMSNVRQLSTAMVQYTLAYKGALPVLNAGDSNVNATLAKKWWTNHLVNAGVLPGPFPTPADEDEGLIGKGILICPSRPEAAYEPYSAAGTMPQSHYGLNDVPRVGVSKMFGYLYDSSAGGGEKAPYQKITRFKRSSQVIMLGDAERRMTRRGSHVMKGPFGGNKWNMAVDQGWIAAVHGSFAPDPGPAAFPAGSDQNGSATNVAGVARDRKRYANMGFFDGHAEAVPFRVLQAQVNDLWGRQTW